MDEFNRFSVCIEIDNLKVQELVCMLFSQILTVLWPSIDVDCILQHEKHGSVLYFDSLIILVIWAWIRIGRTLVLIWTQTV